MQVIAVIVGVLVFALVLAVIMALPVMLLWNWLMPLLFGLKTITFLQALGLSLLVKLLFPSGSSSSSSK